MKNTPYMRQFSSKKGIAPIIIALIVAVVLGGGYAVVKTNPGIAKKFGLEKQVEKKEANAEQKEAKKDDIASWKTYTSTQFGFEIKYPANYFIYDYGVIPDAAITAAIIAITDSKKTYDSTSSSKVVVYASRLPVGFKNSEEYLKYMHSSYPSMKEITVTKENRVDLGGTEGIQFFGVQKDSETGREANTQSILGYSDKIGYEVVSYSSEDPLFSNILSTFKFIPSSTTATSDWKNYKSKALGIELAYPPSFQVREKTDTGKKEDTIILFSEGSSSHALATIRIKEINVNTILELKAYLQTRGFEADIGTQVLASQADFKAGEWNALEREISVGSDGNIYEVFILLGGNRVIEINYGSVGGLNRKINKEAKKDIFDPIINSITIYK